MSRTLWVSVLSLLLAGGIAAAGLLGVAGAVPVASVIAGVLVLWLVCAGLQVWHTVKARHEADRGMRRLLALQEAFDRAPGGIAVLGPGGAIEVANDAYALAMRKGAASAVREALKTFAGSSGSIVRQEVACREPSGEVWWAQLTAMELDGHSPQRVLVRVDDVTGSKAAAESLDTNRTQLSLQSAAVEVLSRGDAPAAVIPALLRTLGEHGGWTFAGFWSFSPSDFVLRCVHTWVAESAPLNEFVAVTQQAPVALGKGLAGRVWESGEATWLSEAKSVEGQSRLLAAERAGLRSAFAFPVRTDGTVRGVVEFWGPQEYRRDGGFTTAMTAVSTHVAAYLSRHLEREESESRLRVSEERYRTITEIAQDAIVSMDAGSIMVSVNRAAETLFGYTREELVGKSLTLLMPENLRESHMQAMQRYLITGARHLRWEGLEFPAVRKDGGTVLVRLALAEFRLGQERTFTGYMRDITDEKAEESALLYQALHDTLTDLPNRVLLQERVERALVSSHRQRSALGLMFMDLDRFKEVNDTLGHHAGDMLLQEVSKRLLQTLRESDTVARLGGDEFGILLPLTDEPGAALTARRILDHMRQPFSIEDHRIDIGGSIGIALYPDHGHDVATLMRRADVAMYAAKRTGSGYTVYSADRDEANAMRLVMTGELRRAIDGDQLLLHFQPKVHLKDGRAREAEALIRWQHPERGFIPPDGFIPLAEETGLVKPLTTWLLGQAIRQHSSWKEQGYDIRVSVNFSAKTLHDPDLVETVLAQIARHAVEPSALQVEITESALMIDPDRALQTLGQLHNAGVWTSIDDFGTGYSSLGYLKQLPVDEIKIDKSFVLDMASSRDDASIVRSVVTLGHNLGLQVVAEGVENKRALDMLAGMECDIAQGFYLSRPLPAFEFLDWLQAREARALEVL